MVPGAPLEMIRVHEAELGVGSEYCSPGPESNSNKRLKLPVYPLLCHSQPSSMTTKPLGERCSGGLVSSQEALQSVWGLIPAKALGAQIVLDEGISHWLQLVSRPLLPLESPHSLWESGGCWFSLGSPEEAAFLPLLVLLKSTRSMAHPIQCSIYSPTPQSLASARKLMCALLPLAKHFSHTTVEVGTDLCNKSLM